MHPILFSLGPLSISSFGFFVAFSFLLVAFLLWKNSSEELLFGKSPIDEETLFDCLFIFSLSVLIGARLIFVFSHFDLFGFNLFNWFLLRKANGFSFLGGFFVGTFCLLLFCRHKKIHFWDMFDLFSLSLSLALSFCFLGAFLDGLGAGAKTNFPWGVLFAGVEGRRHPVQLLAAASFLCLFLVLKAVRLMTLKKKVKKGLVTLSFLGFSGVSLFLLDFLKERVVYWQWITKDQILYLGMVGIGFGWLYKRLERSFRSDVKACFLALSSHFKKMQVKEGTKRLGAFFKKND